MHGGYRTAYTTRTVHTLTCTAVGNHQTVALIVAGNGKHIIVESGLAGVPHVAHRNLEIRGEGQLNQSVGPVLVVLIGEEVLQFAAEGELAVDLPAGVGYEHVGANPGSLLIHRTGQDLVVVILMGIHELHVERLRELLLDHYVEIVIVAGADLPEVSLVSVGSPKGAVIGVPGIVSAHEAGDVAGVEDEFGAILAAERRAPLEGILERSLESPFTGSHLGGVGIEGGERVGMLVGECRHIVERHRQTGSGTLGAEPWR